MSETKKSSGLSTGAWIAIGVIGVIVAGGCLVSCLGFVGLGFTMPAVRAQQQAVQAEAARQQAENAAAGIRAEQEAAENAKQPAELETTQPEVENAPASESSEGQEEQGDKPGAAKDGEAER